MRLQACSSISGANELRDFSEWLLSVETEKVGRMMENKLLRILKIS